MTHKGIMNFYQKNLQKLDQKVNKLQNTVCLQQQIYASPENFTPTLLVMLVTFRRSALSVFFLTNMSVLTLTYLKGFFFDKSEEVYSYLSERVYYDWSECVLSDLNECFILTYQCGYSDLSENVYCHLSEYGYSELSECFLLWPIWVCLLWSI